MNLKAFNLFFAQFLITASRHPTEARNRPAGETQRRPDVLNNPPESLVYTNYDFDTPIPFGYVNPNAQKTHEIVIDKYWRDWNWAHTSMWGSLCGDGQDSWNTTCVPKDTNSIELNGKLPNLGYGDSWPLNPGFFYEACIYDYAEDAFGNEISTKIGGCNFFNINKIPQKAINKAKLTIPEENKYDAGDEIKVQFKTKINYLNQWIGLVVKNEADLMSPDRIPDPLSYIYTGCGSAKGDLAKYLCSKQKKKGTVTLSTEDLESGKYYICLSFTNNPPHTAFKCAKEVITIK